MKYAVIGDVHGCLTELQCLLRELGEVHPVFVGDLVDKGPDSLGVLRFVRELPNAVVIAGNHEEKASRQIKRGIVGEPWTEEATAEDWEFIDSMPLTWTIPRTGERGPDLRIVHAGILPALLRKHPDAFEKIAARGNSWRKGGGKVMNRARRMLRVRYVNSEGDLLRLGENTPEDPFWADVYEGEEGFVIYGHSPWKEVRRTQFTLGIDTSCVFGGKLTAAIVEIKRSDCLRWWTWPISTVSVPAIKQYAKPIVEEV